MAIVVLVLRGWVGVTVVRCGVNFGYDWGTLVFGWYILLVCW